MAEFVNVHIGSQLQVSSALPGNEGSPENRARDPLVFGKGRQAIPGTIFASGSVLVGSPISYQLEAKPEAALMVARPNPGTNPKAADAESIFKVTTKSNKGPMPKDIVLGDRGAGPVGIQVSSLLIDIFDLKGINIVTPKLTLTGKKEHTGMNLKTGVEVRTGTCNETGFKFRSGVLFNSGISKISSICKVPLTNGRIFTGKALIDKDLILLTLREKERG